MRIIEKRKRIFASLALNFNCCRAGGHRSINSPRFPASTIPQRREVAVNKSEIEDRPTPNGCSQIRGESTRPTAVGIVFQFKGESFREFRNFLVSLSRPSFELKFRDRRCWRPIRRNTFINSPQGVILLIDECRTARGNIYNSARIVCKAIVGEA